MRKVFVISISALLLLPILNFETTDISNRIYVDDIIPGINDHNGISDITKLSHKYDYNQNPSDFFTRNKGQLGNDLVDYYLQGKGVWFTDSGMVFDMDGTVIEFDILNRNRVNPVGIEKLSHYNNYFIGNDPEKWYMKVENYQEILYENIYDDIDLRYYFSDAGLKYDFIVHPGGNPENIMIEIKGADGLKLCDDKELKIYTDEIEIIDKDLFVYQIIEGRSIQVETAFKLIGINRYSYSVMDVYDPNYDLVIDPQIYNTYLGGSGEDYVVEIEIDDNNNYYLTGITSSPNFPVKNGSYDTKNHSNPDIFLMKIKPDGVTLEYSTYIGGNGNDTLKGFALDSHYQPNLVGITTSTDFPTTTDAKETKYSGNVDYDNDSFICILHPNGSALYYSSYFGYTLYGADLLYDIAIDSTDNIFVTGRNTPQNPAQPYNFVAKLSPSKTLSSGYGHGGSKPQPSDLTLTIGTDGTVILTGSVYSYYWPTTENAYDKAMADAYRMVVTRFNSDVNQIIYSTFFGPMDDIWPEDVLVDSNNNVIVVGHTTAVDLPVTSNALSCPLISNSKGFIVKFDTYLSDIFYSSYFNAGTSEYIYDAVINENNTIYFTGVTNSPDFPIYGYSNDKTYNGNGDAFLAVMDINSSQLKYSSFFGGNESEIGFGIALGSDNKAAIVGSAGNYFPMSQGSFDPDFNGGTTDGFMASSVPNLMDLKASKQREFRGKSVTITSNATIIIAEEKMLTPHFEYIDPDHIGWKTDLLSIPVYRNDHWESVLTIPLDAQLGYYGFRIRYNNSVNEWTNWMYLNGSFQVLNNPPAINYFNSSKHIVEIGEMFHMLVNGTDKEDELKDLAFEIEYKHVDGPFWLGVKYDQQTQVSPGFEYRITLNKSHSYGYYDFRVMVYDSDIGYSNWSYIDNMVLVSSGTPRITQIDISPNVIYRNEITNVFINCTDPDSDFDELFVQLQYKHDSDSNWINLSVGSLGTHWEASLKSKKTWALGNYSFRAIAFDFEENFSPWIYHNNSLMVLNNEPELTDMSEIPEKMDAGGTIAISIDGKDKENPEASLIIDVEYRLPEGNNWLKTALNEPYYFENSWHSIFSLPYDAVKGSYSFRARVGDLDGAWSSYVYRNDSLTVSNSKPMVTAFDQFPKEVFRTETIYITSTGFDMETENEVLDCNIFYQEPDNNEWYDLPVQYNTTGKMWEAVLQTTKSSILGNYSFKVYYQDGDGVLSEPFNSNKTVQVRNNLPVISKQFDDIIVAVSPRMIKLTEYGSDVETSGEKLIWMIDYSTVNLDLFHIEDEKIGNHEITIYPVKSKEGKTDISFILIDADNGKVTKSDVTIIITTKTDVINPPSTDINETAKKPVEGKNNYHILIIIIIIIFIIIILFFIFHRKKKIEEDRKEELRKEEERREEDMKEEERKEEELNVITESIISEEDSAKTNHEGELLKSDEITPRPIESQEAKPPEEEHTLPPRVPMPAEAPKPQLPPVSSRPEEEANVSSENSSSKEKSILQENGDSGL